jgi:hypothetical protein
VSNDGVHVARECFEEVVKGSLDDCAQLGQKMATSRVTPSSRIPLDYSRGHVNDMDDVDTMFDIPQMDGGGDDADDEADEFDWLHSPPHSDDEPEDPTDILREPGDARDQLPELEKSSQTQHDAAAISLKASKPSSIRQLATPRAQPQQVQTNSHPTSSSLRPRSVSSSSNSMSDEDSSSSSSDSSQEDQQEFSPHQTPAKRKYQPIHKHGPMLMQERKRFKSMDDQSLETPDCDPKVHGRVHSVDFGASSPPDPIDVDEDSSGDDEPELDLEARDANQDCMSDGEDSSQSDGESQEEDPDASMKGDSEEDTEAELNFPRLLAKEVAEFAAERATQQEKGHMREQRQRERRQKQSEEDQFCKEHQRASSRSQPQDHQAHSSFGVYMDRLLRYRPKVPRPKLQHAKFVATLDEFFETSWRKQSMLLLQHMRDQPRENTGIELSDIKDGQIRDTAGLFYRTRSISICFFVDCCKCVFSWHHHGVAQDLQLRLRCTDVAVELI